MMNGRKRVFATFAGSIVLAASTLVATPAPAQYGGGSSQPYCCSAAGCGFGNQYGNGYGYNCCYNDGYGWYSAHVWGYDACYMCPPDQSAKQSGERPSKALRKPRGGKPA